MADLFKDFVFTRNTTTVDPGDTTFSCEDVTLFPSNTLLAKGDFYIAFESSLTYPPTFELMKLVSVNTTNKVLTVVRGQAGTTAQSHAILTFIKGTLTSDMLRRARAGMSGTTTPAPDADLFTPGDRFFHSGENRHYTFTGRAAFLADTFTRDAASAMGTTEVQTVVSSASALPGLAISQATSVGYWLPTSGVFGINASGQAYLVSGGSGSSQQVNVGGTDVDFSFDVFASNTAGSQYGIHFRTDLAGLNGYYLQFQGTTASLFRVINGTNVPTNATASYAPGATHTWRVVASGNNVTVYRDGSQVLTFTDPGSAFTGCHVGFRYTNATSAADTSIFWDNFTCTHPGNTTLDTPVPQGWAVLDPSVLNVATNFLLQQLTTVENGQTALINQVDDLLAATANVEATTQSTTAAISVVAANYDDLLPVIADLETAPVGTMAALPVVAAQVDDLLDILKTSQAQALLPTLPWSSSTTYLAGDQVTYGGWIWRCAVDTSTGTTPFTAPTPAQSLVGSRVLAAGPQVISVPAGVLASGTYYFVVLDDARNLVVASGQPGFANVSAYGGAGYSQDPTYWQNTNFGYYCPFSATFNGGSPFGLTLVGGYSLFGAYHYYEQFTVTSPMSLDSLSLTATAFTSQPGTARVGIATSLGTGPNTVVFAQTTSISTWAPVSLAPRRTVSRTNASSTLGGELVLCNGTFTVTLPSASYPAGIECFFKNVGTGVITVAATAGALIDGNSTFALSSQYASVRLISDGTNWQVF